MQKIINVLYKTNFKLMQFNCIFSLPLSIIHAILTAIKPDCRFMSFELVVFIMVESLITIFLDTILCPSYKVGIDNKESNNKKV